MSFTFLREPDAGFSEGSWAETSLSELLKSLPIAATSSSNGKETESCPNSPSGTTSKHSGKTIWNAKNSSKDSDQSKASSESAADFLVRILAPQEREKELQEKGLASGRKWLVSLMKYDLRTSSWRTHQCSLAGGLALFSGTWPQWGMMLDGVCYQQKIPALPTRGNGSGFFATPTTMDTLPPKSPEALNREATITRPGRSKPANLRDQISNADRWPTPCLPNNGGSNGKKKLKGIFFPPPKTGSKTKSLWPTPTACMAKGSSENSLTRKNGKSRENDRLDHKIKAMELRRSFPTPTSSTCTLQDMEQARFAGNDKNRPRYNSIESGSLNPDWVEWLMGWPIGWTSLDPMDKDHFETWVSTCDHWESDTLPKTANKVKNKNARLKAIGNGQVPQCAALAIKTLKDMKRWTEKKN